MLPRISKAAQHIHQCDHILIHSSMHLILEIFIEFNLVQYHMLKTWTKDSKYLANILDQDIVFYWLKD